MYTACFYATVCTHSYCVQLAIEWLYIYTIQAMPADGVNLERQQQALLSWDGFDQRNSVRNFFMVITALCKSWTFYLQLQ